MKWRRVAATLGGLAGFQILFGLAAVWYCHHRFEIVDDIPTLSSMLADFPGEERETAGAARQGKFVDKGGVFRWESAERMAGILG